MSTSVVENFTGPVDARLLRDADSESRLVVYEVTFASSSRTHWHTHPRGQALHVTSGRARVQLEGQPVCEHATGAYVWVPPGVRHWHGAAPGTSMTHLAVQEAAPDGSTITWGEPVTDDMYDGGPDAAPTRAASCPHTPAEGA